MKNNKQPRKQRESVPENETRNQKFIRIATKRGQVLGKQYNLLTRLPRLPTYEVTQENAQKLMAYVEKFHKAFIERYQPIADGQKMSKSGEIEKESVF